MEAMKMKIIPVDTYERVKKYLFALGKSPSPKELPTRLQAAVSKPKANM